MVESADLRWCGLAIPEGRRLNHHGVDKGGTPSTAAAASSSAATCKLKIFIFSYFSNNFHLFLFCRTLFMASSSRIRPPLKRNPKHPNPQQRRLLLPRNPKPLRRAQLQRKPRPPPPSPCAFLIHCNKIQLYREFRKLSMLTQFFICAEVLAQHVFQYSIQDK